LGLEWLTLEGYLVAQLLNPFCQPFGGDFGVELIEIVGSQILIGLFPREHVIHNHQNGMSHGNRVCLLATPCGQTMILRREIVPFAVRGGMCRLDQSGA